MNRFEILLLVLVSLQCIEISGDTLLSPEQARKLNPETGLYKIQYNEIIPNKYKIQIEGENAIRIGCYGYQEQGKWYPTNYITSQGSYRVLSNLEKPVTVVPKSGQAFELIFSEILPQCASFWNEYIKSIPNIPNLIPDSSNILISTYKPPIDLTYSRTTTTPSFGFLRQGDITSPIVPNQQSTPGDIRTTKFTSTTNRVDKITKSSELSTVTTEAPNRKVSVTQTPYERNPSTQLTTTDDKLILTTSSIKELPPIQLNPIPISTLQPFTQQVANESSSISTQFTQNSQPQYSSTEPMSTKVSQIKEPQYSSTEPITEGSTHTLEPQYSTSATPTSPASDASPSTAIYSYVYRIRKPTTTTYPSTDASEDGTTESYYTVSHRRHHSQNCADTYPGQYLSESASSDNTINTEAPSDFSPPIKLTDTSAHVHCKQIELQHCTCTCPTPKQFCSNL